MNNKGQSLVTFILLIPLLFVILSLIYDLGSLTYESKKIKNNLEEIMEYSKDNMSESLEQEIYYNLNKNLTDIEINIVENDIEIKVNVKKKVKAVLFKNYSNIDMTYKINKTTKRIEKEG